MKEAKDACAKAQAEKDKMDEEMEEEKKKSSDAAISERVEAIMQVKDQARKVAGDKFSCDSMNVVDIQKAALKEVRKSVDWDAKEHAYIQAAFDMQIETADSEEVNSEQVKRLAADASSVIEPKENPRQKAMDSMVGAWKHTVKEA